MNATLSKCNTYLVSEIFSVFIWHRLKLISGFHRASLLSVTFIKQLMQSIITVVDVKIYII